MINHLNIRLLPLLLLYDAINGNGGRSTLANVNQKTAGIFWRVLKFTFDFIKLKT